jgi:hypothetical protein
MTISTIVLIAVVAVLVFVLFSIIRLILKATIGVVGFGIRIITLPFRIIRTAK